MIKQNSACKICERTTTGKSICWDCGTIKRPKPNNYRKPKMITGRLDVQLTKYSAEALGIDNPNKEKQITAAFITEKKVKETIQALLVAVIEQIATNHNNNVMQITSVHTCFVNAAKELNIKYLSTETNKED